MYPSNYGGSFLDTNGDFVVLIVKGYDTDNLDFVPKNAVIKPCKYPYNELLDVMDTISEYKPSVNREIYSNFMVSYIDEKKNRIVVELIDFSEEAIQTFRENVSNSEAIIFVKSPVEDKLPVNTATSHDSVVEIEYIPSSCY